MAQLQIQDPAYEAAIRESFAQQTFLAAIGAELSRVACGEVEIALAFREDLLQHHGFLHGAVVAAIADTACGYAARTLMPAGSTVLTVEYKVNFLAPAIGERLRARGRVLRAGRRLTVCSGDAFALANGRETPVAALTATMTRAPALLSA